MSNLENIVNKLSWWEESYLLHDVDYTIIGSGIVGLSTAIELKLENPELNVLLIDKKTIPIGASTKNAGFACFGSISEILDDIESYGLATTEKLIQMRWRGLSILKSRVSQKTMSYNDTPGIEIFEKQADEVYYSSKLDGVNKIIERAIGESDCLRVAQGDFGFEVVNRLEGSLNPQLMLASLELEARALGVKFIQGVDVKGMNREGKYLATSVGRLPFNNLVVCTNGFSLSLLPDVDILPARNQVLISTPIPGFSLDGCYHMHQGYVYFRSIGERLLIGGGRQLDKDGETTTELGTTDVIIDYLSDIAQNKILKAHKFEIEKSWSGILGVGSTKMPIVQKVDENILIAIRMGGMGVAVGSYIGRVAASILISSDNSDLRLYVND